MRNNILWSGLFVLFITSGCAFAPKVIHLDTPPRSSAKNLTPNCVLVKEFKDDRKDPLILGHTYNLGIKTSDVKTFANVGQWLQAAYKNELESSGGKECTLANSKLTVTGTIKEISQKESWNINTIMKIELTISDGKIDSSHYFKG